MNKTHIHQSVDVTIAEPTDCTGFGTTATVTVIILCVFLLLLLYLVALLVCLPKFYKKTEPRRRKKKSKKEKDIEANEIEDHVTPCAGVAIIEVESGRGEGDPTSDETRPSDMDHTTQDTDIYPGECPPQYDNQPDHVTHDSYHDHVVHESDHVVHESDHVVHESDHVVREPQHEHQQQLQHDHVMYAPEPHHDVVAPYEPYHDHVPPEPYHDHVVHEPYHDRDVIAEDHVHEELRCDPEERDEAPIEDTGFESDVAVEGSDDGHPDQSMESMDSRDRWEDEPLDATVIPAAEFHHDDAVEPSREQDDEPVERCADEPPPSPPHEIPREAGDIEEDFSASMSDGADYDDQEPYPELHGTVPIQPVQYVHDDPHTPAEDDHDVIEHVEPPQTVETPHDDVIDDVPPHDYENDVTPEQPRESSPEIIHEPPSPYHEGGHGDHENDRYDDYPDSPPDSPPPLPAAPPPRPESPLPESPPPQVESPPPQAESPPPPLHKQYENVNGGEFYEPHAPAYAEAEVHPNKDYNPGYTNQVYDGEYPYAPQYHHDDHQQDSSGAKLGTEV